MHSTIKELDNFTEIYTYEKIKYRAIVVHSKRENETLKFHDKKSRDEWLKFATQNKNSSLKGVLIKKM